jgi:hypothetical protein
VNIRSRANTTRGLDNKGKGGGGKGREMTQTLYAHMNIIKKEKKYPT